MKKWALAALFLTSVLPLSAQEAEITQEKSDTPQFSLNTAIVLSIENNYEIQKQKFALAVANGQYRQARGALDIEAGVQGQYSMKQNPIDEKDPNHIFNYSFLNPNSISYGIYQKNTLVHQTGGSLFLKKLFSFGLQTSLSYNLQRSHNFPDYIYSDYFNALSNLQGYSKYSQEKGRNSGEIALELSLPLFKSFRNSITALQIESAHDYLNQMEYQLRDTISQALINTSKLYWNYFIAYKNMEQYEILQKKIEERNEKMPALINAGIRSKNDLLAMEVNVKENRRRLENAKVECRQAKFNLMNGLGISNADVIGKPENPFSEVDLTAVMLPTSEDLNDSMFEYIENHRSDFNALKKRRHAAELKIRMAKAAAMPDANIKLGVGVGGVTYSDDFGKVISSGFWNIRGANVNGVIGVSTKLGNNEKKGARDQAEAEYNSIINEYNKLKNTLSLQVTNATEKLGTYKTMVSDADEVLKMQKNLYENEQKRFNAGLITVDNLLNQDTKYIEAENSYNQLLINYMQSVLEFKYYTATLVNINSKSIFEVNSFYNEDR